VSVEGMCCGEVPIMVGKFKDAFRTWEGSDFGVHRSGVGFVGSE
jgi:hypothetical protein